MDPVHSSTIPAEASPQEVRSAFKHETEWCEKAAYRERKSVREVHDAAVIESFYEEHQCCFEDCKVVKGTVLNERSIKKICQMHYGAVPENTYSGFYTSAISYWKHDWDGLKHELGELCKEQVYDEMLERLEENGFALKPTSYDNVIDRIVDETDEGRMGFMRVQELLMEMHGEAIADDAQLERLAMEQVRAILARPLSELKSLSVENTDLYYGIVAVFDLMYEEQNEKDDVGVWQDRLGEKAAVVQKKRKENQLFQQEVDALKRQLAGVEEGRKTQKRIKIEA